MILFLPVQLLQAQGRTIDQGFGEADGVSVVCDGTTLNKLVVSVLAQNSPWHGGAALASASVEIGDPSWIDLDGGSTGTVSVKLSGK